MKNIVCLIMGIFTMLTISCGPGNADVRLQNQSTRTGVTLIMNETGNGHSYSIYAGTAPAAGNPTEVIHLVAEGTYEWRAERESPGGTIDQGTIEISNDKRALYQDVGLERFEWFDD
jgi:hypothetical protein